MKPSYEQLEQLLAASIAAKRVWETSMMQVCGEDGPKSVGDKFAELQAKCAALAAENAGLKECNFDIMKHVYRSKTYLDSSRVVDAIQGLQCAIERKACKTTATEAFLAEVRAQGVDAAIEHLLNKFAVTGRIGVPVMALELLAKELRKGVQS